MAFTSGQLAKRSGVGIEALRFYEREGLIPKPARTSSGYRQYPPDTVERVRFIRRAQLLGFQLKDVKELLSLREIPTSGRQEVREMAIAKLGDIETKIKDLEAMRAELNRFVAACYGSEPSAASPTAIGNTPSPS